MRRAYPLSEEGIYFLIFLYLEAVSSLKQPFFIHKTEDTEIHAIQKAGVLHAPT